MLKTKAKLKKISKKLPTQFKKIGRVTTASVEKGSGSSWDEWISILTKAGAKSWTHQEIVQWLAKKHKLTPWWQQGVTLGFEIATERRIEGQNQKGEYTVTATRTIALSPPALWRLLASPVGLAAWLQPLSTFRLKAKAEYECEGDVFGEVRTLVAGRRVRMTWQETDWPKPSVFQLGLVARPGKKSILYISHDGLKTVHEREVLRARWKSGLDRLVRLAEAAKVL